MSTKTRSDVAAMLSRSLGEEAAAIAVGKVAQSLGLGHEFSRDAAMRVLEVLANEPGLVGVAARFSKARAHMNWFTVA
jgi:hypothetical protein